MTTTTKTLAATVATTRKAKKLSLRALAKKAALSYQSVYRLEQGEGGLKAASAVLKALGFSKEKRIELLKGFAVQLYA